MTSVNVGVSSGNLERSYSLPPIRRKERRVNNPAAPPHIETTTVTTNSSGGGGSREVDMPSLRNKIWNKSVKAMGGQKSNIRVSKFDPLRVELPTEVLERMQRANNLPESSSSSSSSNNRHQHHPSCPCCSGDIQQQQRNNNNGGARKDNEQGGSGIMRRIHESMNRKKSWPADELSLLVKIAELKLIAGESLGISIKKRKLTKKQEAALISSHIWPVHKEAVFVSKIRLDSTAGKNDQIRVGDQVVCVNGIDVTGLCVKKVAAMMVMMKDNLRVTLRTFTFNVRREGGDSCSCSNHQQTVSKQAAAGGGGGGKATTPMATLHEDDIMLYDDVVTTTHPVLERRNCGAVKMNTSLTASVYDNGGMCNGGDSNMVFDIPTIQVPTPQQQHDPIQQKFDESLQLLQDAIMGYEKSTTSSSDELESSWRFNSANSSSSKQQQQHQNSGGGDYPETDLSDFNSCFNDILNTVRRSSTSLDSATVNGTATEVKVFDDPKVAESTSCIARYDELRLIDDDPDYDDVPTTSDCESETTGGSLDDEIDIDELDPKAANIINNYHHHQHQQQQQQQPQRRSRVTRSKSLAVRGPYATVVNGGLSVEQMTAASSKKDDCSSTSSKRPACFPLVNSDDELEINWMNSEREWLCRGSEHPSASPSLQTKVKALDAERHNHNNISSSSNSNQSYPHQQQQHPLVNNGHHHHHRHVSSSESASSSPSSPVITRASLLRSHEHSESYGEAATDSKQLLKSQLSLPLSSPLNADTDTAAALQRNNSTNDSIKYKSRAAAVGIGGNESSQKTPASTSGGGSKETVVSAKTNVFNNRTAKTPKGEKSVLLSPGRSRKKNWGQKLTRKFRQIGGQDNSGSGSVTPGGMSSNISAADLHHFPPSTEQRRNASTSSSSSSWLPISNIERKVIGKRDSAVLNRYHLDISMAHQRRISRQLLLGNNSAHHDPALQLVTLSQFKKYKPLPYQSSLVDGCLVITIYGVCDLKKSLCEANCLLQVDDATDKRVGTTMQTCRGGQVAWNQCFEMTVNKAKMLQLTIYSWEIRSGKLKKSSQANINLTNVLQGIQPRDLFYKRLAVRLEPRGTIYIKIALEPSSSNTGPLMFGADLQSIVDREKQMNKSTTPPVSDEHVGIPRLVHHCIEEVEKRGMQVVGIYRLCGSAIVKRELRQKLEESKTEVSLTAENYPDVNVITGILKDFLRELPQPLFPPELLEAVTTLMENNPGPLPVQVVNEAFQPAVRQQQQFQPVGHPHIATTVVVGSGGITSDAATTTPDVTSQRHPSVDGGKVRTDTLLRHIEQLTTMSNAEKSTLYALMNHLKKVALHNSQNKMNCQNLAVCFGPVLLGPTNTTGGIDISGAIGFKRHIQVLNYMLSNWPAQVVIFRPLVEDVTDDDGSVVGNPDQRNSSSSLKRVSLTRRLSRVISIDQEDEEEAAASEVVVVDSGDGGGTDRRSINNRSTLISLDSIAENSFVDPHLDMYSNRH